MIKEQEKILSQIKNNSIREIMRIIMAGEVKELTDAAIETLGNYVIKLEQGH